MRRFRAVFVCTLLAAIFTTGSAFGQQDNLRPFSAAKLNGVKLKFVYSNNNNDGSRQMFLKSDGGIEPAQWNEVFWRVTDTGHLQFLKSDKSVWDDWPGYVVTGGRAWAVADCVGHDEDHVFLVFARGATGLGDDSAPTRAPVALHTDPAPDTSPLTGDTVQIANPQASIKSLEIYETDTGLMLGQTSEVTLTATRGKSPSRVAIKFVTPVGDEMSLSRDEAQRFIRVKYPNWYVDQAEFTFEDKYTAHDGGSIGAALGTLMLSVIEGFKIDPNIAITGDISANGKVRAIGGVSAKLRGAAASKCSLVLLPMENYGQLVDAVIYSGPSIASDVQVIGISDLDDAIAAVRLDRATKLSEAIAIFGTIQYSLAASPAYLKTGDAQAKLAKVLELAPQHLSAKVLLAVTTGVLPKTLSPTASRYYISVAAGKMLDVLKQRANSTESHQVPSSVVRTGLAELRKLRPLADPQVSPLIDAWVRFISALNEFQQNEGNGKEVEAQRQSLLDEMAKEQSSPELMQKMLKEGV